MGRHHGKHDAKAADGIDESISERSSALEIELSFYQGESECEQTNSAKDAD